jgi:predicted  nucleic acid-binding Zn-ribbon protein
MKDSVYREYHKTIIDMIRAMGIEATDDDLKKELTAITKDVVHMREKITNLEQSIYNMTNSDEIKHLEYDIQDAHEILNELLQKLEKADKKYICFKEYLRRRSI